MGINIKVVEVVLALVGVGERLSKEEIEDIVVNGKNAMPQG